MTASAPLDAAATLREAAGRLAEAARLTPSGRIIAARGTIIEAELPGVRVGDLCLLRDPDTNHSMTAEVVGFNGVTAFLAPAGDLRGISTRLEITSLGHGVSLGLGPHLLGSVIDAFGQPLDDSGARFPDLPPERREIEAAAPHPLDRPAVANPFVVGIRSIDGFLTVGRGQRLGIFGSAGAGKSTLVSDIVRAAQADVTVVGLIGERGREVGDFLRRTLPDGKRDSTVIVTSTSDRPAVERMRAALAATTVAEYFRDQGRNVLLIVDSVTRLARAMREIGLAAGEPPTRRGFPPSVFALLPRLFERAGTASLGSITAFYTVLVEGDIDLDPVAEEVRSLLDGHVVLSPELAQAGHFPAIDILESRSRLMEHVATPQHVKHASRVRELIHAYKSVELLIRVGEYKPGGDPLADEGVAKIDAINAFLRQDSGTVTAYSETVSRLAALSAKQGPGA